MITDDKEKELINNLQDFRDVAFDNYHREDITDNERIIYLMELSAYEMALELVMIASRKSNEEITNG